MHFIALLCEIGQCFSHSKLCLYSTEISKQCKIILNFDLSSGQGIIQVAMKSGPDLLKSQKDLILKISLQT